MHIPIPCLHSAFVYCDLCACDLLLICTIRSMIRTKADVAVADVRARVLDTPYRCTLRLIYLAARPVASQLCSGTVYILTGPGQESARYSLLGYTRSIMGREAFPPFWPTEGYRTPPKFHTMRLSDSSKVKLASRRDSRTSAIISLAQVLYERRKVGARTHFQLRELESAATGGPLSEYVTDLSNPGYVHARAPAAEEGHPNKK